MINNWSSRLQITRCVTLLAMRWRISERDFLTVAAEFTFSNHNNSIHWLWPRIFFGARRPLGALWSHPQCTSISYGPWPTSRPWPYSFSDLPPNRRSIASVVYQQSSVTGIHTDTIFPHKILGYIFRVQMDPNPSRVFYRASIFYTRKILGIRCIKRVSKRIFRPAGVSKLVHFFHVSSFVWSSLLPRNTCAY